MTERTLSGSAKVREIMTIFDFDQELEESLVTQVVDAVKSYQVEKRGKSDSFFAFIYLFNPQNRKFLVCNLKWKGDHLDEFDLLRVCSSKDEVNNISGWIQRVSPETIELASPQFLEAFTKEEPVVSKVYVPNWSI